jgi:hypothetical protein
VYYSLTRPSIHQDDTFLAHVFGGMKWALASNTTRAFNPNGKVGHLNPPSSSTSTGTSQAPAATSHARKAAGSLLDVLLAAGTVAGVVSLAQSALVW